MSDTKKGEAQSFSLSPKATLTVAFMTVLVSILVLCVTFSSAFMVLYALAIGDEVNIPNFGMFSIIAVTAMALMAMTVAIVKIVMVMRAGYKKMRQRRQMKKQSAQ